MKRNMMRKNLWQSIKKTFGRYIAIVAIIALGSSMFVGLKTTKSDMVATGQMYMDEQNMFDLRILSTYGWSEHHVQKIAQLEGIEAAEGIISMDVIVDHGGSGDQVVYRIYNLPQSINQVYLCGGRMPQAPNECLADGFHQTDDILGTTVTVSPSNEESALDGLNQHTFTVVGYVSTPLYMDMNRGTTSAGNGAVSSYLYIPKEAFAVDYYTEINVTLQCDYDIYTDKYNVAMDEAAESLEEDIQRLADLRLVEAREEALQALADGRAEYEDGLAEFQKGKEEAQAELDEALDALNDAQKQLDNGIRQIEAGEIQLIQAQQEINNGWAQIAQGRADLEQGRLDTEAQFAAAEEELENSRTATAESLSDVSSQLIQLSPQISQIETIIAPTQAQISQLDMTIAGIDAGITAAKAAMERYPDNPILAAQCQASIERLQAQREPYESQRQELIAQQEPYLRELNDLYAQRTALMAQQGELWATQVAIEAGSLELQIQRAAVQQQLKAAEEELAAAEAQLIAGQQTINGKSQELDNARAELEEAKQELADGWAEYREGKLEAEEELQKAQEELDEAAAKLDDAQKEIESMVSTEVFILDRNTNMGYSTLNSSSDIVDGVAKVFPAFFLLVAALVCITTMTRMVDEERTQIGTLKALGYSNGAIISKYLFYAGSGAVVGCGLGVLAGSVVFPKILWQAYCILLHLTPDVVIQFDWVLCSLVVIAYSAVMLLVTWYCCRKTLSEEPAELIRPKPPTSGKKIFLEFLPLWHKIGFLNKVALRNIFRYRQRLAMMLIGIGGCTALLVTGFGIRDSIVNIAGYQFAEITTYDMEVYFSDDMKAPEQEDFRDAVGSTADNLIFFHQSSVELDNGEQVKEIYMIAADDRITEFINFHSGKETITMPGLHEILLSVGVAEVMDVAVGDQITLRDPDMRTLTVTVHGIYDNNVSNYCIILPETIQTQWGELPGQQMAFLDVSDGQDAHQLGARISGLDHVMNVSISKDVEEMVGSMMDAMDLVVITVVICAGMLAIIVLYNLINININERIREIATIKVLGFNAAETAAYVFKENLVLTVMGALIGLLGGKFLLDFVMSQIKIDLVWLQARVSVLSLLASVVLTVLAAFIVDYIFYFKLEKINMAEALKSVE